MIPIIKSHEYQRQLALKNTKNGASTTQSTPKALEDFYTKLACKNGNRKNLRPQIQILNDWCAKNKIKDLFSSFEDIVLASYEKIEKIKEELDGKTKGKKMSLGKDELAAVKQLYNNFPRVFFVKSLGITVCPYCNRNFINSTATRTLCQLDHFFNKADYPLFYVSYFNLVPVCASCNHIKKTQNFEYSPHNTNFSADQLITFGAEEKGSCLTNPDNLEIEIKCNNKIMEKNVEMLQLKKIYQIHTDFVADLYKKKQVFNDDYIQMIYKNFQSLFSSEQEVRQLILSTYINEEEYHKRPLSKLTHDISKTLKLI